MSWPKHSANSEKTVLGQSAKVLGRRDDLEEMIARLPE